MKKILLLGLVILLLSADCQRESEYCHLSFYFTNNSPDTIFFIPIEWYPDTGVACNYQRSQVLPNEQVDMRLNSTCFEDWLQSIGGVLQLFVFKDTGEVIKDYRICDSLQLNAEVVERLELRLEDLKINNFSITYP